VEVARSFSATGRAGCATRSTSCACRRGSTTSRSAWLSAWPAGADALGLYERVGFYDIFVVTVALGLAVGAVWEMGVPGENRREQVAA
jgi:hypothetical protein